MDTALQRLAMIGFTRVGQWQLADGTLTLTLAPPLDRAANVLYAFVVSGELKYIGKTVQPLRQRMTGYRAPGLTQETNKKNHKNIVDALQAGRLVEIYALPDNGLLHYGGFHLNLAAGLEDSLIRELAPPWNGGQKETPTGEQEPIDPAPSDT